MTYKKTIIQSEYDLEYQDDIEKIVLGSILIDKNVIHTIAAEFQSKLFATESNNIIAEAIIKIHLQNKPVDLVLLVESLKKDHKLDQAGGIVYISSLTKPISGTSNIEYHLRLLQQFWLAKYINDVCNESQVEILNYKKDIFDVYAGLQTKLELALKGLVKTEVDDLFTVHKKLLKESYENQNTGGLSGVPTGLRRVDVLTNGWQKSDLIIVAGRPGMGKTALALSLLVEPSVNQKIPTAFFSLEMSKSQIVSRIQSMKSGVDVSKIVKKQLTYEQINHIELTCREFETAPMHIDDTPGLSIMEFKSKARKLVRENGVKLIIIDYLQLMQAGFKTNSREQEISEISKSLKSIAKELDIPIIALSQLSRSVEQRGGNKIPLLSDLRESGSIEQDADMVVFCYRPEYYGLSEYDWGETPLSCNGLFMFIVAKHRNGVLGEIPLEFIGSQTKIQNHPSGESFYNKESHQSPTQQEFTPISFESGTNIKHISGSNIPISDGFNNNINGTNIPDNKEDIDFFNGISNPLKENDDFCEETPF